MSRPCATPDDTRTFAGATAFGIAGAIFMTLLMTLFGTSVPIPPVTPTQSGAPPVSALVGDRKSTRLNSSHLGISYAVFCLKKKKQHHLERAKAYHDHTHSLAHTRSTST